MGGTENPIPNGKEVDTGKKGSGEERGEGTLLIWCAKLASEMSAYLEWSIFLEVIQNSPSRKTYKNTYISTYSHTCVHVCICIPLFLCCFLFFKHD